MSLSAPDLTALAPELVLTLGALLVLTLDFSLPKEQRSSLPWVTLATLILSGFATLQLWGRAEYHFGNMLAIDNFRLAVTLILLLGCGLTVLASPGYLEREKMPLGEYYALLLFATLGMTLMAGALDLIMVFVGLETLSISVYILTAFARGKLESNEAGLKYLLIGAFATAFLLYGIALVFGATGSTGLYQIGETLARTGTTGDKLLLAGLALLVVGFGFKVAAFPFHVWAPDVYEGAPTPITAFMATGVKAAAFAAFLRVFASGFAQMHGEWVTTLFWLSICTMTVGNLVATNQTDLKRMLAYSSIAHAGYLLIALVVGNSQASSAMVFYLLSYTFMTVGAFMVLIYLGNQGETNLSHAGLSGLGFRYPWASAAMVVFMVSLSGFPPTAGFFAKFYLFQTALDAGYPGLVVVAVLNSVVSVFYYLRVVVSLYMERQEGDAPAKPKNVPLGIALGVAVVGVMVLGLFPSAWQELARDSVLIAVGR
ncbi:MAG TPA: NADH-quinone oxidoreductase subunit N [Armatimonadota bacterium]|jgi:NADH-quinone oxidoreductase subunit N